MAQTETLTLEIQADLAQAQKQIAALTKMVEKLSGKPVEIEVKTDARAAERTIDDLIKDVSKLDSEQATIALAIAGADVEAQIKDLLFDINKLDTEQATVDIKIEQIAQLTGDLDKIKSEIKAIDDLKAEPTITVDTTTVEQGASRARGEIDKIPRSAGGANSALANMVGNAGQDLGALAGIAGSAGVAIGQMAEYASDARLGGEGLSSVLKNMGTVAGPIAAIAIGTTLVSALAKAGEAQEKYNRMVNEGADAIDANIGSYEAYADALDSAFSEGRANNIALFTQQVVEALEVAAGDKGEETIRNTREAIGQLGLTINELGPILAKSTDEFDAWAASQLEGQNLTDQQITQLVDLIGVTDNYNEVVSDLVGLAAAGAPGAQELLDILEDTGNIDLVHTIQSIEQLDDATEHLSPEKLDDMARAFLDAEAATPGAQALVERARAMATGTDGIVDQSEALEHWIVLRQEANAADEEAATQEEMRQQFIEGNIKAQEAATEAEKERIEAAKELALAIQDSNEAAADAARELDTVASRIDTFTAAIERSGTALGRIETDELIGFVDGMRGMGDAMAEANRQGIDFATIDIVPDTWEEVLAMPEELRPVVEAIGTFGESVNSEMAQAFAAGGSPGVIEWAHNTQQAVIDEIKAMNLGVTEEAALIEQALQELGLTDPQIEAYLTLQGEEKARAALEIFASDIEDLPDDVEFRVKTLMANGEFIAALELINQERIRQGQDPIEIGTEVDTQQVGTELDTATAPRTVDIVPRVVKERGTAGRASEPEDQTQTVTITAELDPGTVDADLDALVEDREANLNVKADDAGKVDDILDKVARPTEDGRLAPLFAKPTNVAAAETALDAAADPRTAKYFTSYGTAAAQADAALDIVAEPRTATFFTSYGTAAANADAALDAVAAPRTAPITVDLRGEEEVARLLDLLDNPRTVVITTRNINSGSSSGGGSGLIPGNNMALPSDAPMAMATADVGVGTLAAPAPMSISPMTMVAPAAGPVTNNFAVTVQAAVIGNRGETERVIAKALRSYTRLNGRRN